MNTVGDAPALAVLADPTRARIVRLIREADGGRAMVSRLAEQLGLRQPTVSHHMAALHAEGLVVREPEGRRVWYSIHPDEAERVAALLGTPAASAEEPDWERMVDDLAARYRGVFSRETVAGCLDDSRALLAARGHAPLFASRVAAFTASRLDDLHRIEEHGAGQHGVEPGGEETGAEPRGESTRSAESPTVLFVCVQNAGRSQLAAGILRQLAGDRVVVRTAGSAPAAEVRSAIVTALDEIGVPLGGEFPKPLTDEAVRAADVVVTMGCGDACPVYPGRRYLDWDLADPVGQPLGTVRAIRDDIAGRVRALLAEILPAPTS
ncbi:MAG: metalloregulator ArsR/SmtB family transcription factor [Candidatus Microbacterium phytovorans]|uniref:Metalloregulator ArsR/SmtB family transcription factor n=1 Tax=Candidatus Microbacterium phytovorans TaxID=3121374 RepID=A0AAJ5W0Q8_9MICO|nr:metalloregulator ArsR/SmtB family transcription factor [Microbacterium sp.]WEK13073.1 MAG: metalloregulator ArsR/SmtB family transcription factor [Microbacterium sp.]